MADRFRFHVLSLFGHNDLNFKRFSTIAVVTETVKTYLVGHSSFKVLDLSPFKVLYETVDSSFKI